MQIPKSIVTGIRWPGLPASPGAVALALQFQLEQSQWMRRELLASLQLHQLGGLLAYAQRHNVYWQARLANAGYDPAADLDLAAFRRLPILTRADVQEAGKSLFSAQTPKDHGRIGYGMTSGSTGKPIEYANTELCQLFWRTITLREHLWNRRDLSAKLAIIRAKVSNAQAQGWGPSTDVVYRTGPSVTLDVRTPVDQQLRWLETEDPEYLLSYPSNLAALAQRYSHGATRRLTRLRELRTLGEVLDDRTRNYCEQVFEVPVIDMYSASETGYIALQCPESGLYHVQSEFIFAEVLRQDGAECSPGEVGRLVVTPLHNFCMPLIRYEIGDYAEVGDACPCGRGLPVLKRILGRTRNMLTTPDGQQRWPVLDYKAYEAILPIRQLRMIQHDPSSINVEIVASQRPDVETERRLIQAIRDSLGYPFSISFEYLNEIPRSEGGKFEDFISRIPADSTKGRV